MKIEEARIMGRNFIDPREEVRHFDIFLTREEIEELPEIPFSEKDLKESNILFLVTDSNGNTEWEFMSKVSVKLLLCGNWKPFLQLGSHRFPLRPFLWPLVKDIN